MAKRKITNDIYNAVLDAFREHPGNYSAAQKLAKADPRTEGSIAYATMRKAWNIGWPEQEKKSIKAALASEALAARRLLEEQKKVTEQDALAALVSDEALIAEQARNDAITARVGETKLVRAARENAIELLTNSKELLQGFGNLAPKVTKYLENLEINDDEDVKLAAQLLWRLATSSRAATAAGMQVLQMERLLLGQPTEIIGVKDVEGISEKDALVELEEAAKAADRVRKRRERRKAREAAEAQQVA
jgi:hypothetical protein